MCYAQGSIDQAISTCPMCKFFKHSGARCPHVKDICRKRDVHPRHDVVFLKNAEVQTFNGCGFCKWAESLQTKDPSHSPGNNNRGWPGCCRPPAANEYKFIQAADWPAVSVVHHVPIPPEIKVLLESVRGSPTLGQPAAGPRSPSSQPTAPSMERKISGGGVTPVKLGPVSVKSAPMAIPSKPRSSGSPKQTSSSLSGSLSRGSGGLFSSSPGRGPSALEQRENHRQVEKRNDASHAASGIKQADLEGSVSRRSSTRRPSILQTPTMPKAVLPEEPSLPTLRRRASTANTNASSLPLRPIDVPAPMTSASMSRRPSIRRASLSDVFSSMKLIPKASSPSSGSGSSAGSGSLSESTVTSEGFTDYLSDESEAEIQRQAEVKAAVIAQNHMEEMEFKVARHQLANVGLRPPNSWNPSSNSSTSRSQAQTSADASFTSASYPVGHMMHGTPQSRSQVDVAGFGRSR